MILDIKYSINITQLRIQRIKLHVLSYGNLGNAQLQDTSI